MCLSDLRQKAAEESRLEICKGEDVEVNIVVTLKWTSEHVQGYMCMVVLTQTLGGAICLSSVSHLMKG